MIALAKPNLSDDLRAEIARLHRARFPLVPLGGGHDGKRPLRKGWADKCLTLAQILGPIHRAGVAMYGIRLDRLAVVDCDTDDPTLVTEMEARFGPSPVHVLTPRGRHLYYGFSGKVPNLRREGMPVDIKTGPNSYVAGPFSTRPDGGFYTPTKGVLGASSLPPLITTNGATTTDATVTSVAHTTSISTGNRHSELLKKAIEMVAFVDTQEELTDNLCGVRDDLCECPETLPDNELVRIAGWAWNCRLENRIYTGRQSAFPLSRQALDLLRGVPAQEDAIALYTRLVDQHGHTRGKTFPLCHKAMKAEGLTSLSKARFLSARRALEEAGLLKLARKHQPGAKMQTFVLSLPLSTFPNDQSVQSILGKG